MFKRAYVRGIAKALIDCGAAKFANEEQAIAAADEVAQRLPEQPTDAVPPEATAELAANLIDLSNALQQSANSAAQAATSVANQQEAIDVAKAASFLRRKLSADTGSTIVGDRSEQKNYPENSTNAENIMDQKNRPGGDAYANVGEDGVGRQQDLGRGAIASERKYEEGAMGPSEGGSNSATDAVKGASLRNIIKRAAESGVLGTTIDGTKHPQAVTGEGEMENRRRPASYAVKGEDRPGESDMAAEARAAQIGTQKDHPLQEAHIGGTNTAIKQSADAEYTRLFKAIGQKYAAFLPFYLSNQEKVAAVQYLMSIPPSDRDIVVSHIEKTGEMPEGLKTYIESKKEKSENGETKEEEVEEKEEEKDEKKEKKAFTSTSNLLRRLRRLQA